ncbi:hypothetical protein ACIBO2_20725 [Nonomuraea sp. NPDC050022]|uniref:hypothetical protein n=1 Tax=unclassified Nonomuraea TaxID=2593643 RepID=UPI0033EE1F5F
MNPPAPDDLHDCNAICLGGPCHGLLTHVDQDIGILTIPVPRRSPDGPEQRAGYRVTRERVRYWGQAEPYIALHRAGPPCSWDAQPHNRSSAYTLMSVIWLMCRPPHRSPGITRCGPSSSSPRQSMLTASSAEVWPKSGSISPHESTAR